MQNFSYHTHTVFSDGHNTIEEMLDRAEELGWREIGISDHLIVHKNITRSRSFPRWMNSPMFTAPVLSRRRKILPVMRKMSAGLPAGAG